MVTITVRDPDAKELLKLGYSDISLMWHKSNYKLMPFLKSLTLLNSN